MAPESHRPASPPDRAALRRVMGAFATGVSVITTERDGTPHGMTANSVTSVSLDPPLLLVCLVKDSRTAGAVRARRAFVVNILALEQEELSNRFSQPGQDHFASLGVQGTVDGLPILTGSLAHVVCDLEDVHPGGDHEIVVGRVRQLHLGSGRPLIFFRGKYDTLTGQGRDAEIWYW